MFGLPIWAMWLILCGIFLIIEIFNVSFLLLWPGIGAFLAFIAAILDLDISIQIAVFVISTTLMILFMKPLVKRFFKNKDNTKMNNKSIIDKTGIVIKEIDPLNGNGQVKVAGELWSATSYNEEKIKVGSTVKIKDLDGVKLIVENFETEEKLENNI